MPPLPEPPSDQVFNNADSFAQAFDEAWKRHCSLHGDMSPEVRSEMVLEAVSEHPFARNQPEMVRQVIAFRIRLLGL
jgi:hypothetical protein